MVVAGCYALCKCRAASLEKLLGCFWYGILSLLTYNFLGGERTKTVEKSRYGLPRNGDIEQFMKKEGLEPQTPNWSIKAIVLVK